MIYSFNPDYPAVSRNPADILTLSPPHLGLDFEWDIHYERPTILGVSDGKKTVSVSFNDGWDNFNSLLDRYADEWKLVGHNFLRAERPILLHRGRNVPLANVEDSIVWHWLVNAHLCKAGGKATGDSGGELERRGPGFMNIWTMCSIHTSLPCWKFCRGSRECHDIPCDVHHPFWYNGLDALGPVLALGDMKRKAQILGVDSLYPMHVRLNEQFQIMNERGVWVDKAYIENMRAEFRKSKEVMWSKGQKEPTATSLPFNPRSWQQAIKYFDEKYSLHLEDTEEETIRAAVTEHSRVINEDEEDWSKLKSSCSIPELADYLSFKEMGNGPDRWYANKEWNEKSHDWEGYVVDEGNGLGTIHPNINHFTSTGRTACSNPNLQNIEKRRIDRATGEKVGKRMRKAIIAPEGYNLYSADYSNGENRVFLHLAGYVPDETMDFHSWMAANIGFPKDGVNDGTYLSTFAIIMGGAREAAKSVTHAQDYLEGLDLLSPAKLRSSYVMREERAGARLVFRDWKFRDYTVSFTGANLAARAFGSKDWNNRKLALQIGERYFSQFPKLRDLQRRITKQVEEQGMVRVPHGYVLRSYDRTPGEMLKTAAAMWGSNPVAHYLKLSLLNMEAHPRLIPVIPVHDEHVFYADVKYNPKDVKKWAEECMVFETPEMPGFRIPMKIKVSTREIAGGHPNWKDMKEIE